jgi:hypothetical protein
MLRIGVVLLVALAAGVPAAAGAVEPRAQPKCFGAAARDPERPCHNPRLARSVTPAPEDAVLEPNIECGPDVPGDLENSCVLGVAAGEAVETAMMIGDSHAQHWRPALAHVALKHRWRLLEAARPHCSFSLSAPAPTEAGADFCVTWNERIVGWLTAHPEVRTVFISNNALLPMAVRGFDARVDGSLRMLQSLPPSVQRIVVIRDVPTTSFATPDCIRKAKARRKAPGPACARGRRGALPRDATAIAAFKLRARGVRVIDLSRHFCNSKRCFPVVGGVLVHRDRDHLTRLFAQTLGPYLLRRVDAQFTTL